MAKNARQAPGRKPSLTLQQLADARLAYESGISSEALAERHGVTPQTVRRLLRSISYKPRRGGGRPRRKTPTALAPLLILDAQRGLCASQLAVRWHLPLSTVHQVLDKAGVVPSATPREPRYRLAGHEPPAPLKIARRPRIRTATAWTDAERAAIDAEIAAGRVLKVSLRPLWIPIRTALDRKRRGWTDAERAAIAREIQAGRVLDVPLGFHAIKRQALADIIGASYRYGPPAKRAA